MGTHWKSLLLDFGRSFFTSRVGFSELFESDTTDQRAVICTSGDLILQGNYKLSNKPQTVQLSFLLKIRH